MKVYPAYKKSGVIWFDEIPQHWNVGSLKFRLANNDGGVWGNDAEEEGTIVLRSTEIDLDGNWRIDNPAIRLLTATEIEKALLKTGDLLITKSSGSEAHIGKTALVTPEVEALRACYSNFMQRIRPNWQIESPYLHYFLNSSLAREQYNYQSTTTTGLANLNAEIIGNLKVPFIPISEQQAIADFLDCKIAQINTLIEKKQRQIDLLQEQRMALINHAVTKGLNPDAPMKDSGVEWLGAIPSHWTVSKIKRVCSAVRDGTHAPPPRVDGIHRLLSARNIIGDQFVTRDDDRTMSPEDFEILQRSYTVEEGDVIIAIVGATTGKSAIAGKQENVTVQRSLAILRPSDKIISSFLNYWIKTEFVQNNIQKTMTQYAAQPGIYLDDLSNLRVLVPPVDEQTAIVNHLSKTIKQIEESLERFSSEIELLREYRTALISEAVTGKINVIASRRS